MFDACPSPDRGFRATIVVSWLHAAILATLVVATPLSTVAASRELSTLRKEKDFTAAFGSMLDENDSVTRVIEAINSLQFTERRSMALAGLATALQRKEFPTRTIPIVERLRQEGLESTLFAGDLLIASIDVVKVSSYGLAKPIKDFPDELCDQAASLLSHPNPIVQAQAEWMLALRVKKQDSGSRALSDMFLFRDSRPSWYDTWKSRPGSRDLRDDYARQLIQLQRHHSCEAVQMAIDAVAERIATMAAAPSSTDVKQKDIWTSYEGALRQARDAVASGQLAEAHQAYLGLRHAAREVVAACRIEFPREGMVFFTNPRIPGGVWNVNVPVTGTTNTPAGELWIKRNADPATAPQPLLQDRLGPGAVHGIDLDWDADKLLFSYWHKPINGQRPFGWDHRQNAHLYELDLRTGEIEQQTSTRGSNDIEPAFLPDGSYVFASDRSSFGNQCAGPFLQNKRCTTLFRLNRSSPLGPVAISNNKDFDRHPHVLNDGTVVFLHWEYQERSLYNLHNAWRCRPDGTNMDAYFKQHISVPFSIRDVQQAPESELHVATVQGHHDAHNGPVVLFDPSRGINSVDSIQLVTPGTEPIEGGLGQVARQVVPEGGVENRGGSYISPFPISDKGFVVGHDLTANESEFAIYYIDVWGNRELIHKDDDMSAFMPHPLRRRARPPILADQVDRSQDHAVAFVEDVYRDLPGVAKGDVKFLRISQRLMLPAPVDYDDPSFSSNHLHYLPGDATTRHFAHWTWAPTRTVGRVKVAEDGSAYFKVPAGTPVFLQALDENLCEVRRMRTSFTLQPGEFRGCAGCHETRLETTSIRYDFPVKTLQEGPQTPVPPPWGDTTVLDYRHDIQPIFDEHCVACHDETEPAAGVDLSGREIGGFSQSYRTLFGLKADDATPIRSLQWHLELHPEAKRAKYLADRAAEPVLERMQRNEWPGQLVSISDRHSDAAVTRPYQFGSNRSKLIRILLDDPTHQAIRKAMQGPQWEMLVTWVDYNAPYHSTVIDVSQFNSTGELHRLPYALPSPWIPADVNPSFLNSANTPGN